MVYESADVGCLFAISGNKPRVFLMIRGVPFASLFSTLTMMCICVCGCGFDIKRFAQP